MASCVHAVCMLYAVCLPCALVSTACPETVGLPSTAVFPCMTQIAVVEIITSFLFLLGRLGIIGGCGIAAYIWLDKAKNYQEGGCRLPCCVGTNQTMSCRPFSCFRHTKRLGYCQPVSYSVCMSAELCRFELVLFPPLLLLSGGKDELSSVIVPIILVLVLAYVVAATFLGVYKLAIDTILVCFCEDLKVNNGSAVRVVSRIPCVQRRTIACVCLWPWVCPCRTSVR